MLTISADTKHGGFNASHQIPKIDISAIGDPQCMDKRFGRHAFGMVVRTKALT